MMAVVMSACLLLWASTPGEWLVVLPHVPGLIIIQCKERDFHLLKLWFKFITWMFSSNQTYHHGHRGVGGGAGGGGGVPGVTGAALSTGGCCRHNLALLLGGVHEYSPNTVSCHGWVWPLTVTASVSQPSFNLPAKHGPASWWSSLGNSISLSLTLEH